MKPSQLVAMKDTHYADTNANTAYEFINNPYIPASKPEPKRQSFIINQRTLPKGVLLPKGADVNANIAEAKRHYGDLNWFYNQVKNHGPWDYKQQGAQYETLW